MSEVAIKVWIRGWAACWTAAQARSISLRVAPGQPGHLDFFQFGGDLGDGFEIPFGSRRKTGFNYIDARVFRVCTASRSFSPVFMLAPGGLLPVPQSGIENNDTLIVVLTWCLLLV